MDLFASVLNRGRPSSSSSPAAPAVHRSSAAILKRWRQLVSRAYYVVSAAFCQQLSWELLALAGISSDAIQRSAGGRLKEASAKSVPAPRQHGVTWVIGARIGDSTMKGKAQKMFNECQREVSNLIDAGNKHKYWRTCRTCHGRWDRIPLLTQSGDQATGRGTTIAATASTIGGCGTSHGDGPLVSHSPGSDAGQAQPEQQRIVLGMYLPSSLCGDSRHALGRPKVVCGPDVRDSGLDHVGRRQRVGSSVTLVAQQEHHGFGPPAYRLR